MLDWLKQQFELWIERRDHRRQCKSCETLKEQLFQATTNNNRLLEQIIELTNPKQVEQPKQEDFKPIMPRVMPWHVKKNMLETEARAEAAILREKEKEKKELDNTDLEDEVMKLAEQAIPEGA